MDTSELGQPTALGQPTQPPPGGFPIVALAGDGQLGRMMQQAAIGLGIALRLVAESHDTSAAQVIPRTMMGDYHDQDALLQLAQGTAAFTVEHEHVPPHVLDAIAASGVPVRPSSAALAYTRDKIAMRQRLSECGFPVPRWRAVADVADVVAAADDFGWPLVLKKPSGGYDGRGVWVVEDAEAAQRVFDEAHRGVTAPAAADTEPGVAGADTAGMSTAEASAADTKTVLLAEEKVPFARELAALVARSPSGQAAAWPVVQTIQADGICSEVIAPAPDLDAGLAAHASALALRIAAELEVVGVLAVELFEVPATAIDTASEHPAGKPASRLLINELAMRPHNSGHWSIDGAVTSQFEQHLRAVLDLPLGDPSARQPWAVMVNILGADHDELYSSYLHVMAKDPSVKVHLYGKQVRHGRKLGHVTVYGDDLDDCRARARHAADFIAGTIDG